MRQKMGSGRLAWPELLLVRSVFTYHMPRTVVSLLIIAAVGGVLYFALANAYTEGTANIITLGYFLLTVRFLDLLETIEGKISGSAHPQ